MFFETQCKLTIALIHVKLPSKVCVLTDSELVKTTKIHTTSATSTV